MPKPDRLAGLTEEEQDFYTWNNRQIELAKEDNDDCPINDKWKRFLESLAASRATAERRLRLLERSHSFIKWLNEQTAWQTMSPHRDIGTLVKEIAAELRGGG